jgi:hypothetical protein
MHTIAVIAAGLGLLAVCALAGRFLGGAVGAANGALLFLPAWLVGAAINLYVGVKRAGYSFADEAPVFVVVFAIPGAIALLAWWRLR